MYNTKKHLLSLNAGQHKDHFSDLRWDKRQDVCTKHLKQILLEVIFFLPKTTLWSFTCKVSKYEINLQVCTESGRLIQLYLMLFISPDNQEGCALTTLLLTREPHNIYLHLIGSPFPAKHADVKMTLISGQEMILALKSFMGKSTPDKLTKRRVSSWQLRPEGEFYRKLRGWWSYIVMLGLKMINAHINYTSYL